MGDGTLRALTIGAGLALAMLASARSPTGGGPWHFAVGASNETLDSGLDRLPAEREPVDLPHRVLLPDTALWYVNDLLLPGGAVLEVDADDGAQVYVGGRRLRRVRRWFFVDDEVGGTRRVVVRVLNNAMEGGLRAVRVVDARGVPAGPPLPAAPSWISRARPPAVTGRALGTSGRCCFSLWGDSQGGWDTFSRLVGVLTSRPVDFSAGVGDLVQDGSDRGAWLTFARHLAPLAHHTAVALVPGNHDYDGFYDDLRSPHFEAWFRGDGLPTWMAWSCGPVRFAAIDLNREFPIGISSGSPQADWFAREVASPSWLTASWRVLLVHQPPWSKSWPGYDGDAVVRQLVERLVRDAALDVVVSGHSHAYERTSRVVGGHAVHAFVTGGAGGSLEPAASGTLDHPDWRVVVRHHVLFAEATTDGLRVDAVDATRESFDRVTIR